MLIIFSIAGCGGDAAVFTPPNPLPPPPARDLVVADAGAAPPCADTLAGVGRGNFTIRFSVAVAPHPDRYRPLVNQRTSCGVTPEEPFWLVGIAPDGRPTAQTNGVGGYTNLYAVSAVDDEQLHTVVVARREGVLQIIVDGRVDAEAESFAYLDVLPRLEVGTGNYCGSWPVTPVYDLCITQL